MPNFCCFQRYFFFNPNKTCIIIMDSHVNITLDFVFRGFLIILDFMFLFIFINHNQFSSRRIKRWFTVASVSIWVIEYENCILNDSMRVCVMKIFIYIPVINQFFHLFCHTQFLIRILFKKNFPYWFKNNFLEFLS